MNRADGVDFSEVADLRCEQEFELLEGSGTRGAVEYPVRMSKFGNVSCVDLFFVSPALARLTGMGGGSRADNRDSQSDARDSAHSRLYYLGFLGESRVLKKDPNEAMTGQCRVLPHPPRQLTVCPSRVTVGAEQAMDKMVDQVKEKQGSGQAR